MCHFGTLAKISMCRLRLLCAMARELGGKKGQKKVKKGQKKGAKMAKNGNIYLRTCCMKEICTEQKSRSWPRFLLRQELASIWVQPS